MRDSQTLSEVELNNLILPKMQRPYGKAESALWAASNSQIKTCKQSTSLPVDTFTAMLDIQISKLSGQQDRLEAILLQLERGIRPPPILEDDQ